MTIQQETPTTWERCFAAGDRNDYQEITAKAEGLEIDYDTLPWEQLDMARAALGFPTVSRMLVLLTHAVEEADGWHDDGRGGLIPDDALMEEARALVTADQQSRATDSSIPRRALLGTEGHEPSGVGSNDGFGPL